MNTNTIQKFILENLPIRGEIVRLNESFEEILSKHDYPESVKTLLGEAILTAILLVGTIKFEGHLTLQFQSNGYIKLLVARCTSEYQIRALAQINSEVTPSSSQGHHLLGSGELVVTLNHGLSRPYQSIIPIHSEGITQSIEHYFAQSEQLATKFFLKVQENKAIGYVFQLLPDSDVTAKENFWRQIEMQVENTLLNTCFELDNSTLLEQLFPQQDIRLFEEQAIIVSCGCTVEKMKNAILLYGEEEAYKLLSTYRVIDVKCEFCNKSFSFNEHEVKELFAKEHKH